MSKLAKALIGVLLAFSQSASAAEPPQNFAVHEAPVPVPRISFENAGGQPKTLADFRGKVVLLNIWATWCAPCRKEMPTLDRLQGKLGGQGFDVVAMRHGADLPMEERIRRYQHNILTIRDSGCAVPTSALIDTLDPAEIELWFADSAYRVHRLNTLVRKLAKLPHDEEVPSLFISPPGKGERA